MFELELLLPLCALQCDNKKTLLSGLFQKMWDSRSLIVIKLFSVLHYNDMGFHLQQVEPHIIIMSKKQNKLQVQQRKHCCCDLLPRTPIIELPSRSTNTSSVLNWKQRTHIKEINNVSVFENKLPFVDSVVWNISSCSLWFHYSELVRVILYDFSILKLLKLYSAILVCYNSWCYLM